MHVAGLPTVAIRRPFHRSSQPAQIRRSLSFNDSVHRSSSLQGKSLSEKLDILTPFLQTSLAFLPDLAGVILSPGKGALGNTPIEPLDTPIERNGGIAIRCLMPETNQKRESIIVIRAGEFTEQARIFTDLYQQENRWLDWALKKLGKLSFDELVHLSE